jgi:hypothetical protein
MTNQFEVNFDHLFECFETPLPLLARLQVQHPLKALQRALRVVLFECLRVVVLVLEVYVRLGIAVLRVLLKISHNKHTIHTV